MWKIYPLNRLFCSRLKELVAKGWEFEEFQIGRSSHCGFGGVVSTAKITEKEVPMADVVDVPPEPVVREEARRDRSKERGSEDRRRDREARERRDDREERAPRRDYTHERRSSQERMGGAGGDRRERDRDYKRRKSVTPPAYRDRRHSPSFRRSPPYKRRRDDDFEGGRRGGSPGEEAGRGFSSDRR